MNIALTWLDYQKDIFFNFPKGIKYKIIPKGRRSGFTRGGANACIKDLIKGEGPWLWGDTINGNIQRYYERYFYPVLNENRITHRFDSIHKKLEIKKHYADFRSEDNPENWEGFAYKKIFLNEAGIILKNRSLYINSVLPMMLDNKDSVLIAAGVPKGKMLRDGTEHPFYTLKKRADENPEKYYTKTFTSYDNPLLSADDIRALEDEIAVLGPEQIRQEIYGEFIEMDAMNPFFSQYDKKKHEATDEEISRGVCVFNPARQITMSIDFNLNPFALTFSHIWEDRNGIHDHQFDEIEIPKGSIKKMIDEIQFRYGRWVQGAVMTGDAMGNNEQLGESDNASYFIQLLRGLGMAQSQLKVTSNPNHSANGKNRNSRSDCNYILLHFPDFKINPKKCPVTCREMVGTQCDAFGAIIKKDRKKLNQRADFADTVRYKINTFHRDWIDKHSKGIR